MHTGLKDKQWCSDMFATSQLVLCVFSCPPQQRACCLNLAACAGAGTPASTQRGRAQTVYERPHSEGALLDAYLTQVVMKEHVTNSNVACCDAMIALQCSQTKAVQC